MKVYSVRTAYHSTNKDIDKFKNVTTKKQSYTGEGAMIHGYGLYLQEDKEINITRYKSLYPTTDIVFIIDDKTFYGKRRNYFTSYGKFEVQHFDWFDDKGNPLNKNKDSTETELFTLMVNKPVDFLRKYFTDLLYDLSHSQGWATNPQVLTKKVTKQLEYLDTWDYKGIRNEKHKFGIQYEVEIPDDMNIIGEKDILDFRFSPDESISGLYDLVREEEEKYSKTRYSYRINEILNGTPTYGWVYNLLSMNMDSKELTKKLIEKGIDGMRYDGLVDGECYVIYNCKKLKIIGKE